MYRQPVGVVHPALTAGAAIGAGAFLLWLKAQAERRALEQFKHSRRFTSTGLYRKPNYTGMSGAELRRATQLLDSWREDFYQDPLTGTMIERREVQRELLRRSGQGGFLFIAPAPVVAPAVSAAASFALGALTTAATALLLRVSLPQLWGWAASRPRRVQAGTPDVDITITGTVPGPDETVGGTFCFVQKPGSATFSLDPNNCGNQTTINYDEAPAVCVDNVIAIARVNYPGPCGPKTMGWDVTRADGTVVRGAVISTSWGFTALSLPVQVSFDGPTARPYEAPTVTVPLPDGYKAPTPEVEPAPRPLPQRVFPLPLVPLAPPLTEPGGPEPLPEVGPDLVPITPGPTAPPAVAPKAPPRWLPFPLPDGTPTKDGEIEPEPPTQVTVTPTDAHFPVPGASPVTGNGPRPTARGIAQELGRLEQKLARMQNPGPGGDGDGTDRLGLLFQTLNRLVDFLTSITAGGGYELSSPCVLNDFDERIVTTVEYGGGLSSLDVLSNKIDALAALIQAHKDLKQPMCKPKKPVGQPVTVNFVQVD